MEISSSSSVLLSFTLLMLIFLFTILYLFNIYPLIQNLPTIINNSHKVVDWAADLLLTSSTGTVTVTPLVFTSNPLNVEHIAKSHFHNFPKSRIVSGTFHDLLGNGIINVNGEQWKSQRKMASYEFSTSSLRTFILDKVLHAAEERLIPLLQIASVEGEVVDLQDVLERLAFDNICSIVLGCDPGYLSKANESGERLYRAFEDAGYLSVERVKLPFPLIWKFKKLLNIGSEKKLRESMSIIHEHFTDCICKSTRFEERGDFLSKFMKDGANSDEFIRDILINFVIAGRDTTPSALTWFFWQISSRPDIIAKILEEIRLIRTSREISQSFTFEMIHELHYLQAAISESMRLYPPICLLTRECKADDTLPDGTIVKKGWMVMYSALAMGRTKGIWGEDCLEFKPERWLVDGIFRTKNAFEYTVFHAGPRMCLGKEMAFVQMKIVAASILERFEMEVGEERGKHQVDIALRMEGGLPVRVMKRRDRNS